MAATPGADRASAERTARMFRGLEWLMIPILIALGFMLASFSVRNSDFWMHLASGRLIANGEYSFGVDPFSHASAGQYWVNFSWLYDFFVYELYNLTPTHSAVVYVKAGLMAFLALIMVLACRPDPNQRIAPGTKTDPSGWIAAILVGLALLAIASRMLLQPMLVSFLFTAITFMVLRSSRGWPAWGLPVTLAGVFILWVNLDSWFFLGPALVALFLIGESLQTLISGGDPIERGRIKTLALTLVAGLAACLVNPHHYHVFTVVPMEFEPNIVDEMQVEPGLKLMFLPTYDMIYLDSPMLGQSVAGYSYGALIVLSLLSFGLTALRPRLSLLLVWLAFLGLSLVNWRLIPFFAVVAAPIAALNVQTYFARRPERRFESSPATPSAEAPLPSPAEPSPVPSTTAMTAEAPREAWWPGAKEPEPKNSIEAPAWLAESPPPGKPVGGVNISPEGMLMFGSIVGRLFTIAVGLLLVAASYPGWLHATNPATALDYRASWDVAINPAYQQFAEQLAQWRQEGKLPANAKAMPLQPSLGNYLAWFAPSEKGFLDYRFQLLGGLSGDYIKVKRGLDDIANRVEKPREYADVLRRHGITHVIISDTNPTEFLRYLQTMFERDDEWSLWFQNGRTAIFGWHGVDPRRTKPPEDPLRVDLQSLAFGPAAKRIPAPETVEAIRNLPPDPSMERTFFDRYLARTEPLSAPETETALAYMNLQSVVLNNARNESAQLFSTASFVASVGLLVGGQGLPPRIGSMKSLAPPLPTNLVVQAVVQMSQTSPMPAACALLAVREAQRGVQERPNSGRAHLVLAVAYQGLPQVGSVIRPWQQMVAARQALARLSDVERGSPELSQRLTSVLLRLYQDHKQRRQLDLALEILGEAMKQFQENPPPFLTDDQRKQQLTLMGKEREAMQKIVTENQEKYDLDLARMRNGNEPLHQQVALAFGRGLIREAKNLLATEGGKDIPTMHELIVANLLLGEPEEAQLVLDGVPEQARPQFMEEQIQVWIAMGDYARAGKGLERDIAASEKAIDPALRPQQYGTVLDWLLTSAAGSSRQFARLGVLYGVLAAWSNANKNYIEDQQRADRCASRGMLALEEGDFATAKDYFRRANAYKVTYVGDRFVNVCLDAMEKQDAKAKKP